MLINYNCKSFSKYIGKWLGSCYSVSNSLNLRWLLKTQFEFKWCHNISFYITSLGINLFHGYIIKGCRQNLWWCFCKLLRTSFGILLNLGLLYVQFLFLQITFLLLQKLQFLKLSTSSWSYFTLVHELFIVLGIKKGTSIHSNLKYECKWRPSLFWWKRFGCAWD